MPRTTATTPDAPGDLVAVGAAPSTATASIVVDADVETVWALVSDPAGLHRFSPENTGAEVGDGPDWLEPGATFTGHNQRDGNSWSTTCTVLEHRPPTLFTFRAGDDDVATTWTFRLRDLGSAGTQVSESFDSRRLRHPEWVDLLPRRHAQLVEDMQETLSAIRDEAERGRS